MNTYTYALCCFRTASSEIVWRSMHVSSHVCFSSALDTARHTTVSFVMVAGQGVGVLEGKGKQVRECKRAGVT